MKVDFFNSKDFLGSKTKESKIRKLSISKSKIMTISVDNLNWMGVTDAVVIGLEEGSRYRCVRTGLGPADGEGAGDRPVPVRLRCVE